MSILKAGKSLAGLGGRKGAALAAYGAVAAYGMYKGANTNGQMTNAILDTTLGSSDIDNATFGEDIGLFTDLKYGHLGMVSKGGGIALGGAGGLVGSIPGIVAAKKAKSVKGKILGLGLAGLGGIMGSAAGTVAGRTAPLYGYMKGPMGQEFVSRQNSTMYMPSVDGSLVFGAYNQRRA